MMVLETLTHVDFGGPPRNRTELQGFAVLAAAKLPRGIMAPFASLIPNPIAILSHLEGGTACILDDYQVRGINVLFDSKDTSFLKHLLKSPTRKPGEGNKSI